MIVEVQCIASYGSASIEFSKRFVLPFAPFFGLTIFDSMGDAEWSVKLQPSDYQTVDLEWDVMEAVFRATVHERWRWPVRPETVDHRVNQLTQLGWERADDVDIAALKTQMESDYNNGKKY